MNPEIQGYIRAFLASLAGGLVTSGWLTQDQLTSITTIVAGLIVLIGTIIWSHWSNKLQTMLHMVAQTPQVEKVVVNDQHLANSVLNRKVTASR